MVWFVHDSISENSHNTLKNSPTFGKRRTTSLTPVLIVTSIGLKVIHQPKCTSSTTSLTSSSLANLCRTLTNSIKRTQPVGPVLLVLRWKLALQPMVDHRISCSSMWVWKPLRGFDIWRNFQFYEYGGGSVFQVAADINGVSYSPATPVATPGTGATGTGAGTARGSTSSTSRPLSGGLSAIPHSMTANQLFGLFITFSSLMIGSFIVI